MKHYFGKREVWQVTEWSKRGSIKKTRNTGKTIYVTLDLPSELEADVAKQAGGDILVTLRSPDWPIRVDADKIWWFT